MINIGIITDITWDNYFIVSQKFKKINSENFRLHTLYGKTLELISTCASKYYLTLIRHSSDNLCKTIYNMLKICDLWLIFTNNIEYNTSSRLIIDKCEEYNIRYLIVTEYTSDIFFKFINYNSDISFKKNLELVAKLEYKKIEEFNLEDYNDNFINKYYNIYLPNDIKTKLKVSYNSIYNSKKENSIKLIYDIGEMKKEKQMKKTSKQFNQHQFLQNRIQYYKNNK